MNIALISLIGLCIAIIVSGVSRVNVGILAMSLAWLIGFYVADGDADVYSDGAELDRQAGRW